MFSHAFQIFGSGGLSRYVLVKVLAKGEVGAAIEELRQIVQTQDRGALFESFQPVRPLSKVPNFELQPGGAYRFISNANYLLLIHCGSRAHGTREQDAVESVAEAFKRTRYGFEPASVGFEDGEIKIF